MNCVRDMVISSEFLLLAAIYKINFMFKWLNSEGSTPNLRTVEANKKLT